MAIVRFVFAALKPGVDAAAYERFEREVDYAVSAKLKTIVSYRTHRITETGAGLSGGPWDYVERIEVTDRAAYEAELAVAGNASAQPAALLSALGSMFPSPTSVFRPAALTVSVTAILTGVPELGVTVMLPL